MEMLPNTAFSAVLSAAALYGFVRCLQMLHVGRKYGAHQHIVVSEETLLRLLLPDGVDIPGVVYGGDRTLRAKYSEFLRARKDAYIQVAMTNLRPNVYIADPQAIKIITTQKHIYVKDVEYLDRFVGCYGQSLLMVEGEVWRRHRKQTQRAFNEKNIRLVWSETEDIMRRLFRIWDRRGCKEVHIDNVSDMTETLGLLVISMAGFGRRISWDPVDDKIPQGHQMSFSNAVRTVSRNLIGRALIPTWAKNLTKTTRDITTAFSEFGQYLTDMVALGQKSSEVTGDQSQDMHEPKLAPDSLINLLLSANCENTWDGGKGLDDKEVAGNIFLFLFAGHESTAHAISFCLGLLALYPEVQQEVYAQIEEVVRSHGGLNACFGKVYDCILYFKTSHVARIATQDSVVSVARNGPGADENTRENFFIPKGSNIWLSLTAVHYNPTYWPEPEKFRPKRFMEPHNKDAFLAFSTGMRSCIGRRFAEVEGTVALALLLERYEIKIDEEKFPTIPGECALVSFWHHPNVYSFVLTGVSG
ncbi:cytochrome P450, partial [Rhizoctonia solani]